MNNNQAIRFYVNEYGRILHIDDLYSKMKLRVFKIKKANQLTEISKQTIVDTFKYWIKAIQQGIITEKQARIDILKTLNKKTS